MTGSELAQPRQRAKLLKIAPKTLRLAAEAGEIEAFIRYRTPVDLRPHLADKTAGSIYRERARQNPRHPAGSHPNSAKSLLFKTT